LGEAKPDTGGGEIQLLVKEMVFCGAAGGVKRDKIEKEKTKKRKSRLKQNHKKKIKGGTNRTGIIPEWV